MISLQPREQKVNELPEPVSTIILINDTMARLDLEAVAEEGKLTLKIAGLYLGTTVGAPFEGAKPKWELK